MFACWHMLRLCAQPTRWSARMIVAVLVLLVLSLSWEASDSLPTEPPRQMAANGRTAPFAHASLWFP